MAVKFSTVQVGDNLFDVRRGKAGNTNMRRWNVWSVKVLEMGARQLDNGIIRLWAKVSWNGNAPKEYSQREIERLYRTVPKAAREQSRL